VHVLLPPTSDWVAAALPGSACLWCRTPQCSALFGTRAKQPRARGIIQQKRPGTQLCLRGGPKRLKIKNSSVPGGKHPAPHAFLKKLYPLNQTLYLGLLGSCARYPRRPAGPVQNRQATLQVLAPPARPKCGASILRFAGQHY